MLCLALGAQAAAQPEESFSAAATNNMIVVSGITDKPDAHPVRPAVYKIEGANYFRLRDLAMVLSGSTKQFAVDYDDTAKTVAITTGRPYRAIGGELSGTAAESCRAVISNNVIRIDGVPVTLRVFKIDGANYFRLRDLGKALDFFVGYDDEVKAVFISGARGYEEETDPANGDAAHLPFAVQYIRTNGYHDDVRYPIVTLIRSAGELGRYYEENRTLYDLSHKERVYADTTIGFADATERYDDAWFERHQLLIVLLEESSGSIRHEVTNVSAGPDPAVDIDVRIPEVCTADMAEWHILIETDRVFDDADKIAIRLTVKNR